MRNKHMLISSEHEKTKMYSFNILNKIQVRIDIDENPYLLSPEYLFGMAARINKKRGYLFVSKILGKHIPVSPIISLLGGALLGSRYREAIYGENHPSWEEMVRAIKNGQLSKEKWEEIRNKRFTLPEQTLFVGFAETATALGYSVFQCFHNASYVHTTREEVTGIKEIISFEEEHSHATSHRCYVDNSYFNHSHPIVFVDDEITTGKTVLNIIRSIQNIFPRKEYRVLSLLDWRSAADRNCYALLEKELGITIRVISLLSGSVSIEGEPVDDRLEELDLVNAISKKNDTERIEIYLPSYMFSEYQNIHNGCKYLKFSGRFGLESDEGPMIDRLVQEVSKQLVTKRKGPRTLCLGTGEFMYLPMRIAAEMGTGVKYQSTTRSPIYCSKEEDYAVQNKFQFTSPENDSIIQYVYNIPSGRYDDVFLFVEQAVHQGQFQTIVNELRQVVPYIHIVTFTT